MREVGRALRARCALAALLAAAVGPVSALAAQSDQEDPFRRRQTGPPITLDSLRVALATPGEWRAFRLGRGGVSGFVDVALAGYNTSAAGSWGLSAQGSGLYVLQERGSISADAHVSGGLTAHYYFSPPYGALSLSADAYGLPGAEGLDPGVEIGLGLRGLEWDWGLEEINPTFAIKAFRDIGNSDAFRGELDVEVGTGLQNVALGGLMVSAFVDGALWLNDYDDSQDLFDPVGGRGGLGVNLDGGRFAFTVRGGYMRPLDAGGRGYVELAAWFRPDGA